MCNVKRNKKEKKIESNWQIIQMGNAEIKAITADSPVLPEEIHRAHQQYLEYERDFFLDKSAFSLLFDTERVSFQLVDQLFEALDQRREGKLRFAELVIGLVAGCSRMNLTEKLDLLFDAIDIDGDGELTMDEIQKTLAQFLVVVVSRLRGVETSPGKVLYVDRKCSGCGEIPVNLVYECVDCNRGMALGVPITVHLCKQCLAYWEGYGLGSHDMLHVKTHKMVKSAQAPNPHVVTHPGVACSVCDMLPIVGTRYRCKVCSDFVNMCEQCYRDGEEPCAHQREHDVEVLSRPPTLEDEVQHLIQLLFGSTDSDDDGLITRSEFHHWGQQCEVAASLLRGFQLHYVKFCSNLEECTMQVTVTKGVSRQE